MRPVGVVDVGTVFHKGVDGVETSHGMSAIACSADEVVDSTRIHGSTVVEQEPDHVCRLVDERPFKCSHVGCVGCVEVGTVRAEVVDLLFEVGIMPVRGGDAG